jgi:hypothetical protein
MASSMLSNFSCILFSQLLSQDNVDVPALLTEVARVWEAATAVKAARAVTMLAT